MEIVGGLYHELCDFPLWRAVRGSGGRAAVFLASRVNARLHCYATLREAAAIEELIARGITVHAYAAKSGIAFAYFHSLSTPHIEPPPATLEQAEPFTVLGSTILRFGLLEGDPVVRASGRAVYDPQTALNPAPFHANGSSAGEWALVTNARELSVIGGSAQLEAAAARVHAEQGAAVIIAKCGPAGAKLFMPHSARAVTVPAYRSERVFKIGSGDVFSAAFALYWGEQQLPAALAADRASRAVAAYCEDPLASFPDQEDSERLPVPAGPAGAIVLLGANETLGQRYVLEEARFRLRELGAEVLTPAIDNPASQREVGAVLLIADQAGEREWEHADALAARGARRVVFAQGSGRRPDRPLSEIWTEDFATALYRVMWASYSDSSEQ